MNSRERSARQSALAFRRAGRISDDTGNRNLAPAAAAADWLTGEGFAARS